MPATIEAPAKRQSASCTGYNGGFETAVRHEDRKSFEGMVAHNREVVLQVLPYNKKTMLAIAANLGSVMMVNLIMKELTRVDWSKKPGGFCSMKEHIEKPDIFGNTAAGTARMKYDGGGGEQFRQIFERITGERLPAKVEQLARA